MRLEGGAFQNLFDAYLYKKYGFKNIQTLGVQTGTNKPTKGTPDSYVLNDDGKYILINYGSVSDYSVNKIKKDILSCFDEAKLKIEKSEIAKIICGHISTNIHIEQHKELLGLVDGVEIELIGVDTLSFDLAYQYSSLAKEYLGISLDTYQIFDIDDFVAVCDRTKINAPIDCDFRFRETELSDICNLISSSNSTVIIGPSGVGKTRIVIEACRKYEIDGWNVLCIKSNSNLLFDDLRNCMEQEGKYLLFFDDANTVAGFEGVLSYIFSLPEEYTIKTVFTVRDYACSRVVNSINEYSSPALYTLKGLADDEIKGILKQNLGIVNEEFLNRIAAIACGNIRLAMLAGMKSVDNGLNALRNAEDIFKNYYDAILDSAELKKEDLILLSLIELAGPIRTSANELFDSLAEKYLNEVNLDESYQRLSDIELIDWFRKEIVKISDQSFGNYIFYYVFYEKKWISISEVIVMSLPRYKDKILYAINTLLQLFGTDELLNYVSEQINDAWTNAEGSDERCYLEAFYRVNPLKALVLLKKYVDSLAVVEDSIIDEEEFQKAKNNIRIQSKEIDILAGLKYTDVFNDAVELLLQYYEKCPDLFMDFYFAITENLLYDRNSHYSDYEKEYYFLTELWNRCVKGEAINFSILFLRVAEEALNTEFRFTEPGRNIRQVSFCKMTIAVGDGIKKIRHLIWDSLFILRQNEIYKNAVDKILVKRHVNGLCEDATKELVLFDFNMIYPYIESNIDFHAAKLIDIYRSDVESLNMDEDERALRSNENEDFRIYSLLTREHISGRSFEENERLRKSQIILEVRGYTTKDFEHLFEIYHKLCIEEPHEQYQMSGGLAIIFESLEGEPQKYVEIITLFLKISGNLTTYNKYRIVDCLLADKGYEQTKLLLNTVRESFACEWKYKLWECVPEDLITDEIACDFFCFLHKNESIVPDVKLLNKYACYDMSVVDYIAERLLSNKQFARAFLSGIISDEDVSDTIRLFANNVDKLVRIYVSTLDFNIDYEGKLFKELYNYDSSIWGQYITWLKDNISYYKYEQNIIEVIWNSDDYKERISHAFENLTDNFWITNRTVALLLFSKANKNLNEERKKAWLLNELKCSYADIEKCKKLIYMVAISYPEWEVEFVLEFTKLNKSIDDFKALYLFSLFQSWSGSEIPLINKRIDFMKKLEEQLIGLEFLEHREYLEERIRSEEKHKKKVELSDYIENSIYA